MSPTVSPNHCKSLILWWLHAACQADFTVWAACEIPYPVPYLRFVIILNLKSCMDFKSFWSNTTVASVTTVSLPFHAIKPDDCLCWASGLHLGLEPGFLKQFCCQSESAVHSLCNAQIVAHACKMWYRDSYTEQQGSHASLKVLESTWIFSPKFKALKYLKTGQVLENPWISFHRSLKVLEFNNSNYVISATSLNSICIGLECICFTYKSVGYFA